MVSEEKERFIHSQIIFLSLAAALQRNKVYSDKANDKNKLEFRNTLKQKLNDLGKEYKKESVNSDKHTNNILVLSSQISKECRDALDGGRFKIGTAQKVLNI